MIRERVGRLLMEAQLVSEGQIQEALEIQRSNGSRLGSILVEMGAISETVLLEFLSQQYGVPTVELSGCRVEEEALNLVPFEVAQKFMVVPVHKTHSRLALAMVDPSNMAVIDEMKFRTGLHVAPMIAMESDMVATIDRWYRQENGPRASSVLGKRSLPQSPVSPKGVDFGRPLSFQDPSLGELGTSESFDDLQRCLREALDGFPEGEEPVGGHDLQEDKAPIVNLVNHVLRGAGAIGASDVHFEPSEAFVRVRFRLDGVLRTITHLPRNVRHAVIARIKIMANLDIAERRLPQDGRMKLNVDRTHGVDVRVSILPCLYGEKVVLRLLDRSKVDLNMSTLGMDKLDLEAVQSALESPYGMILVTGPTGSGKTTTLYSALQYLNTPHVNIVTVEDPVEYHLAGINQLQIREDIGLTFATGLRSFLRQDPDIIMVGEIRDRDTATIAIQAALTGHRVLSTLHTNDAPRAITRLLDMGIEPFLVSSSLSLIIAQRLVRRICEFCKERDEVSPRQLVSLGFSQDAVDRVKPLKGKGCARCHHTGFRGRVALFEILLLTEAFHRKILSRAPAHELQAVAIEAGLKTLRTSGLIQIQSGVTTVEEVAGVTAVDSYS